VKKICCLLKIWLVNIKNNFVIRGSDEYDNCNCECECDYIDCDVELVIMSNLFEIWA